MKIETRDWTHSKNETPQYKYRGWLGRDAKADRPEAGSNHKERWETGIKYSLLLAFVTCILALCGCGQTSSAAIKPALEAPVEVKAIHPHRGEVYRFINLPGEVRPLYEVTLFAKVNGYLDKLTVDKGDSVKAGELIADIDVPELRANLVKYKAELELAQAEFKQMSEGAGNSATYVTAADSDATRTRLAVAGGKVAVAKGNIQYTESMLKYARVAAPFDGIITKRYVDPGAYIPVPNAADTPEAAAIVNL